MKDEAKNRRRNYFIDKNFQSLFILKFCLIVIAGSVLMAFFAYYMNLTTTTVAFDNLKVVVKSTADFILPVMLHIILIVTMFVGIATAVLVLFLSHRIAGPLYKLKMEMTKLKEGDFSSSIHIRSTDQLQRFASECDEMRSSLSARIVTIKNEWKAIKAGLEENERTDVRTVKDKIKENIRKIDLEFSKIKTK